MKHKSVKIAALASLSGMLLGSASAMSATLDDLDKRLARLEEEVKISQDEIADSADKYKNSFIVAGYSDIEHVASNASPATVKTGFRIHHLSLMFKKQVREDLKFFSEIEYEDGPYSTPAASTCTSTSTTTLNPVPNPTTATTTTTTKCNGSTGSGKFLVEAVNFDYALNHSTSVRVGRFFTPAGIWSVDHYPPFVSTQERPQHIRKIFPQVTDGATLSGNHAAGEGFVNYDLFAGNGETSLFDGSGDSNSSAATGLRVNLSLPIAKVFDVGATWYKEDMNLGASDTEQSVKTAYGIHAKIRQGDFGFQGEYADGSYKPTLAGVDYHRKGYYAQFSYDISKWTLGLRHDFYDPKSTTADDSTRVNALIVNYHVDKNTVLKWEHHRFDLEDPAKLDYFKSIASIVVNFD